MPDPVITQAPAVHDVATDAPPPHSGSDQVAPTGQRRIFQGLRRQLSDEDLVHPGVQKLILHMFEEAEAERDEAATYEAKFHESDKEVAVLREKAKKSTAIDVVYGCALAFGCALVGATFYFWGKTPPDGYSGNLFLGFGIAFSLGGVAVKIFFDK